MQVIVDCHGVLTIIVIAGAAIIVVADVAIAAAEAHAHGTRGAMRCSYALLGAGSFRTVPSRWEAACFGRQDAHLRYRAAPGGTDKNICRLFGAPAPAGVS